MSKTRLQKEDVVKKLKDKLSSSGFVVFLNFHNLSVAKVAELRRALRKANGGYVVAKKSLISMATKGSEFEVDKKKLEGEAAVAFAGKEEDSILSVAKEIANFAKRNAEMLKILGGIWQGAWTDIEQIKRLAAIPGREVLLTQLAFMLQQPVASLARTLKEVENKVKG